MNNDNYIVIQGWMRNELNLKGNELMVRQTTLQIGLVHQGRPFTMY